MDQTIRSTTEKEGCHLSQSLDYTTLLLWACPNIFGRSSKGANNDREGITSVIGEQTEQRSVVISAAKQLCVCAGFHDFYQFMVLGSRSSHELHTWIKEDAFPHQSKIGIKELTNQ